MRTGAKIGTAAGYIALLLVFGITDAVTTQGINLVPQEPGTISDEDASAGVRRVNGPDIFAVLSAAGIATQTTREESLLSKIVPSDVEVESRVILLGNDRLAFFAWVESPDAKAYFTALKEALHTSFSSELQDLVDEVQEREGKPVRNVLSFLDPAIHTERILFVRSRQRLYEFHVVSGQEEEIQRVMDELTE